MHYDSIPLEVEFNLDFLLQVFGCLKSGTDITRFGNASRRPRYKQGLYIQARVADVVMWNSNSRQTRKNKEDVLIYLWFVRC